MKKRRGLRRGSKSINKVLRLFAVNAAGLLKKQPTLKKALCDLNPSVFFIEESKLSCPGKIKYNGYVLYENIRSRSNDKLSQAGGGLILGCKKELNPVWIRDGGEETEAISVHIFVQKMKI